MSTLATPWTIGCQAPLSMNFPGKKTGVGCHSFSRGSSLLKDWTCISWIAGNLLHCRQILYHWATREALRYITKRNENRCPHRSSHENVYSNTIHNSQREKQLKNLPTDEWINKLRYPSAMEYYAATKRNDAPTDATTRMNVEQMMWS